MGKGTNKFEKYEYPVCYGPATAGVDQQKFESNADFADGFRRTESPGRNGTDQDASTSYKRTGE